MATPFFLPPPSSFGVPPGCTVSLSSPSLVLTFISVSLPSPSSRYISSSYRCCSKQVLPSANSTQVTSRGLFSWLRTGVTCPPTMGLRKSCEKNFHRQRSVIHVSIFMQGGITCGAIDEPRISSKAIDERVMINFRDKNVVIARFRDKNVYR